MRIILRVTLVLALLAGGGLGADDALVGYDFSTPCTTYTLDKLLGQGAFGLTYRGRDGQGRAVAIKVFRPKPAPANDTVWPSLDAKERRPFDAKALSQEEWDKAQQFDHPHILHFVDRGTFVDGNDQERPFIVMELVDGETLVKQLDGTLTVSLSAEQARAVIRQFLQTLRFTMSQGYYYGDLHPGNVMIAHGPTFKILDIGGFEPLLAAPDAASTDMRSPAPTLNKYLKQVYLIMKRILQKSPHTTEQMATLGALLKSPVPALGDKRLYKENSDTVAHILEQWEQLFATPR